MAIRRTNGANGTTTNETTPGNEAPKLRENSEVNAKIDGYIEKNPKEWAYIQGLPRERLERSLVLQSVQKEDRREKMRTAVMKKLDENPEMKEAFRTLVKNLPAEQQEKAMVSLAMRTSRAVAPSAEKQAQSARV